MLKSSRLVAGLVLSAASVLRAQQPAAHPTPVPSAHASRASERISMDGKLDEAAWAAATPITEFRQVQPDEGKPSTLRTEVRFLFDDEALYVGAKLSDPQGKAGVHAPLARRDQLLDASGDNGSFNSLTTDKIVISLDPYHNHLDEVLFELNPAGVRGDQLNGDPSWDPVWEGAASIDDAGWTAEMRIPYSQLRFSRDSLQVWGLQVVRVADRINEVSTWSFRRKDESSGPAYFGHLDGLVITERPRQLELLPYVVTGAQYQYTSPLNPYRGTRDMRFNAGADIKYNLTSNLTLDGTINPDFGQVEVDPASLNLSAYETFYDEKRPFFVANRSAFSFSGTSCYFCSNFSSLSPFYSRRVGRPPQLNGYVSQTSTYADTPDDATILGAAKITGRTANGYTVGLMEAVADREEARFVATAGGADEVQVVEPLTNYFVGRVRKDLRQGATQIGVIATSAIRKLDDDPLLTSTLRSDATTAGIDWSHAWSNRRYRWRGGFLATDVRGSEAAITATQLSSAHYYQRPDRDEVLFDPTATSLQGYGLYTRLAKENGNWLWEVMENARTPGYETNDLGFLDRTDYAQTTANVARTWTRPTSWYRSMFAIIGGIQQYNLDGVNTDAQRQAYWSIELPNYWNLRNFVIHVPTHYDDRLTRGGPIVKAIGYDFAHLQLSTDARRRAVFDIQVEPSRSPDGTRGLNVTPGVAIKPAANVFVQLSPSYSYSENGQQYLLAQPDANAPAGFDGQRYVFGNVVTKIVSFETRVNWTLRPTVTLQMYAQPFIAAGDYKSFREFAAPRSDVMLDYGTDIGTVFRDPATRGYVVDPDGAGPSPSFTFDDPNFTSRSLRGTSVLRWEYRPGSTLFFVWTQQRAGASSFGNYEFSRDMRAMLSDRPDNVFLVKATYWIGR
jgi:hypothetical protein